MAKPATTVTAFCKILARSKLLPDKEILSVHKKWRTEGGGEENAVEAFRTFLVKLGQLTEYQSALIARGHTEGYHLGDYLILDRIGKGRSAGVYHARHTSGQEVALKVLSPRRAADPAVVNRFEREGRLLTQLNHPNVVRAFQIGREKDLRYIVMEKLEGESLETILARRNKIGIAESVRLIVQALSGLQHLHENRMVHRDLKPSNLMVVTEGENRSDTLQSTVKIVDIGIGRELFPSEEAPGQQLTVEGTILGTPDYLAPEQARDARTADIRADIYSLGCVLHHLIAGRPPFVEKSILTQLVRHATERPVPLSAWVDSIPEGLQTVYDRMTAKLPEERYPTPAKAAEALKPFLPVDASAPVPAHVLAAYKLWLESEPSIVLPSEDEARLVTASGADSMPVLGEAIPVPEFGSPSPSQVAHAATVQSAVAMAAAPKPYPPITPAPLGAAPSGEAPLYPSHNPYLYPPPGMPYSPPAPLPEVEVELIDRPAAEERSALELNRRDLLMLGVGGCGVLFSVILGYGLARVLKRPPPPELREESDRGTP